MYECWIWVLWHTKLAKRHSPARLWRGTQLQPYAAHGGATLQCNTLQRTATHCNRTRGIRTHESCASWEWVTSQIYMSCCAARKLCKESCRKRDSIAMEWSAHITSCDANVDQLMRTNLNELQCEWVKSQMWGNCCAASKFNVAYGAATMSRLPHLVGLDWEKTDAELSWFVSL